MHSIIRITCPKEDNLRYFNRKDQGYRNNLSVILNNEIIFSDINDCEENLPITLERSCELKDINELIFDYDITFHDTIKERDKIFFQISKKDTVIKIIRENYVGGAEKLKEFLVTFQVNDSTFYIDKDFHQGHQKQLKFESLTKYPFYARWSTKKTFEKGQTTWFDDLILEIFQ